MLRVSSAIAAASSRFLPATMVQAQEAIALLNDQGRFLDLNDAACNLFGLPRDRLLGTALADFTGLGADVAAIPLQSTSSCPLRGELMLLSTHGTYRNVAYTLTPRAIAQAHLVRFQPMQSGRANMEAELQRHQQGLALCNELTQQIRKATHLTDILQSLVSGLRHILEADRVLVYQILPDGSGKAISEATLPYVPVLMHQTFSEEVFPRSAQTLYAGGRVRAIANIHDPGAGLAPCLVDFIAQFGITAKLVVPIAYDSGRARGQNALWGLLVAHQCGRPRQWVDFELNLMRQLADQVSLALTHLQWAHYLDTEVEARTAELKVTNHHLNQGICEYKNREQAKDEWVSVISHELRTPLSSLHSALKILATGQLGSLSAAGQQMLSIADQSAERLMRLVTNVLDLQRFEAGKVVLNPQTCAAASLMEQAIAAMAPFAQQHQVTLVSEPINVNLWADPDAVVQVLTNLLSNAIKFSPTGGTVRLSLALKPGLPSPQQEQGADSEPCTVLFQVRDQGQGIPPDQLERIFEEFQQAHPHSRRKGGMGLGLSICRKIVTQHHGMIWAESVWGEGSTFSFTLPMATSEIKAS